MSTQGRQQRSRRRPGGLRIVKGTSQPWLWLADIGPAGQPAWIEQHGAWLSPSERLRLQRIVRTERRMQMFAGHVLLRRLVAARTGVNAREVDVCSQPDGRVELIAPSGWRPSLAHSKQWVAALLGGGMIRVGVDIERMQPDRQIQTIVKLACSIETESREHAYLVWAQREAELKAGTDARGAWVATWAGNALAVCASARPVVAEVDLAADKPARTLELAWTSGPRLAPGHGS